MMTKRTPAQWQSLFADQQISGLSQAQFCKQQGLCPKHFSLRRKQLLGSKPAQPFVKVQPPQLHPASVVSIHYHDIEIRLRQVDTDLIAKIVNTLR